MEGPCFASGDLTNNVTGCIHDLVEHVQEASGHARTHCLDLRIVHGNAMGPCGFLKKLQCSQPGEHVAHGHATGQPGIAMPETSDELVHLLDLAAVEHRPRQCTLFGCHHFNHVQSPSRSGV